MIDLATGVLVEYAGDARTVDELTRKTELLAFDAVTDLDEQRGDTEDFQ